MSSFHVIEEGGSKYITHDKAPGFKALVISENPLRFSPVEIPDTRNAKYAWRRLPHWYRKSYLKNRGGG